LLYLCLFVIYRLLCITEEISHVDPDCEGVRLNPHSFHPANYSC